MSNIDELRKALETAKNKNDLAFDRAVRAEEAFTEATNRLNEADKELYHAQKALDEAVKEKHHE